MMRTTAMKRIAALVLALTLTLCAPAALADKALKAGQRSQAVLELQERLIQLGLLDGSADGIFGNATQSAVKEFQRCLKANGYNVDVDGVAGNATQKYLYDDGIVQEVLTLEKGDRGDSVKQLQNRLYQLSFLLELPDGVYGDNTQKAVLEFQQYMAEQGAANIQATGSADAATRALLNQDLSGYGLTTPTSYSSGDPLSLRPGHLYARTCVLMDADTGEILFEKRPDQQMYPASTTKIMTLMLALEALPLDKVVTIPKEAGQVPGDSSLVPVYAGEEMTVQDLLTELMLRSGNDAANATAVLAAGTLDDFVAQMNARAAQLGMVNTHFVNPHGYHDNQHYTSARDLAILTREALKNQDFVDIVSTLRYTMAATSKRGALSLSNSYAILNSASSYYDQRAFGVKTGYTSLAGYCYVGAARSDGHTLIAVLFNAGQQKENKWTDAHRLFDYGFALLGQS